MGHGVHDNGTFRLSDEEVTLAEILKERGYETAAFVSSFVIDSRFGLAQGFDTYFDFDEAPGASQQAMRGLSDVQRVGEKTAEPALEWLSRPRQAPFLLWLHLYDPHSPFEAPEPYRSRFVERPYDGEVAYTDSVVGDVLDRLETLGLKENTLVMVVGDHGESLGEHDEEYHSWFIYDATLKVPFLVRLPGLVPSGLTIVEQVRLADLAPTALELLEVPKESWQDMQGESVAPWLLEGKRERLPAYAESLVAQLQFGWGELKAIRERGFKYIEAPRPELYDLRADPGELENLADEKAKVARQLRGRLHELEQRFQRAEADRDAGGATIDEETARKLQSLGYVASPQTVSSPELAGVDPKDRIADYREFSATLSEALEAIDSERPEEAIRLLRPLAEKIPTHSLVHYHLGQAYLRLKDYPPAIGELEVALELSPRFSQARADLAEAYIRTGQPQRAAGLLREGLEEQPKNPAFHFELGFAYHAEKRFDVALDAYREAHRLEKTHPQLLSNMAALYLQTGRAGAAITRLEELVELDPTSALAWNNLGLARAQAGRVDQAGSAFKKAADLAPDNVPFRKNLALWYQRMGRTREAEEELRKARSLEAEIQRR
jgi:arylsulfatase A-like enzyme/Tfp pilus assembly protein PilF